MSLHTSVPITARKMWDANDVRAADGPFPGGEPDLRGEIHPDLIRYKGYWYCGLKEGHGAQQDSTPLRRARIIRSADGENWESVKVLHHPAGLVSDLKFSITGEGALMAATNIQNPSAGKAPVHPAYPHLGPIRLWSVSWLTQDGLDWGTMYACPTGINACRYSVSWYQGVGYSLAGGGRNPFGTLYRTGDGKNWHVMAQNVFAPWYAMRTDSAGHGSERDPNDYTQARREPACIPTEGALAFDETDGTACAIVRTHPVFAILGTASPPYYDNWTWRETTVDWNADDHPAPACEKLGVQMGGPVLKYLSNGLLLAAGRADASTPGKPKGRLTLFLVDRDKGILQRWGDFDGWSHYPGIVEHEGELWISCGRQQGSDPFEVYLLRVPIPQRQAHGSADRAS